MSRDESPSCNGSQQESQKLTGDAARETPRTDKYRNTRLLNFYSVEPHDIAFMRELERELNAKTQELEEARKDAERYSFIRSHATPSSPGGWAHYVGDWAEIGMDSAIDSAMRGGQ